MSLTGQDSFRTRRRLQVGEQKYDYFSIRAAAEAGAGDFERLPFSLKVLVENLLRFEDGRSVSTDDIEAIGSWVDHGTIDREIAYRPARVLMQDFTGVPAVVDLAAMRDAMTALGGDPAQINPLSSADLVIDHSVQIDHFGSSDAYKLNVAKEMKRNGERYAFLRWGQTAFDNFRVVPPGTGICHQVNLEYLGQVVWTAENGEATLAFPDTLVGTDSHTTMINGLAVLGWGVGGIEAEAAMLGQPISMLVPDVVGFRLEGTMKEGATATDLVLTIVQMLRKKGVVGKFVEFFGPGLDSLSLADRATIANMAPEYGATCGFFPIDREAVNYLEFSARAPERVALVEAYARAQGMWRAENTPDPIFSDTLDLDLSAVEPSVAGPRRPQDKVALSKAAEAFSVELAEMVGIDDSGAAADMAEEGGGANDSRVHALATAEVPVDGTDYALKHGHIVIASITSCTNTSNPSVMIGAGVLARNARRKGLTVKPWVKTSLAPGSRVVTDYLAASGLQEDLDALGFNLVGYGCATCIGNSGPLPSAVATAVEKGDLVVAAVLSGNRNFEGRISPHVRANYLASPPLVVAYALAGSKTTDLTRDPLGEDSDGNPVLLKDIWPTSHEVDAALRATLSTEMFSGQYADVFSGDESWQAISVASGMTYNWRDDSTYVKKPPYFEGMAAEPGEISDIAGARILALLGDSITTDHISPAGSIAADSPAGRYLVENGIAIADFNSYGSRRGNHEVMMRGTFANIRLRNAMAPGTEGGWTRYMPGAEQMTIFDAAMKYASDGVPLVVVAGKEYGTGSSRDWAAKGTNLLGVRAVIAESFERIHRSNLVGMGVLPLMFKDGDSRKTLGLRGTEVFDISGMGQGIDPGMDVTCTITRENGNRDSITLTCRIDTEDEVEYYRHGGILHFVLRNMAQGSGSSG
jgi:aconitate hydratase